MTTLQKVAKKAGVSIATVSKVLSNTPYFTEETRAKVMDAVDEVGYVPNLAARALSQGKTNIIAVVFPIVFDTIFTDPLVQHIVEGVESECTQNGYNVLLSTPRITGNDGDPNYKQLILSGYLDGIVALDNVPNVPILALAHERNIPAVAIGYNDHPNWVRSDDLHGGQQMMTHILELGHRQIGIITAPPEVNHSIRNRLDGLAEISKSHQLDYASLPVANGDFSIEGGYTAAQELLTNHPTLTALVCLNDRMAVGAALYAQQNGLHIPQDLSIIGYDDISIAKLFSPALTTINQQAPELGRIATQMLFQLLNSQKPNSVTVPTQLVVRQSSAPPSGELS